MHPQNIKSHILPENVFSPNLNYLKTEKKLKIFIGRICVQYFTKSRFLKLIVTQTIENKFSKEMTQNSPIVYLPVLNCNKNNYHDCVTIL